MITQEFVWMLCFDSEGSKCFVREVFQIRRHNHVAATYDRGGQHMTIFGIRQGEGCNQMLVSCHQTVTNVLVHQVARPLKNDPLAIRLVLEQ